MADIDRIIEQLLGDRRISEKAAFSSHTFTDQPIIERGRDFKRRVEEKARHRREREQRIAERENKRAAEREARRAEERTAKRATQQEVGRTRQQGADHRNPQNQQVPRDRLSETYQDYQLRVVDALQQRSRAVRRGPSQQLSPEEAQLRRQLPTQEEALREYHQRRRDPFWRGNLRSADRNRIVFRVDADGNSLGYINESGQCIHDMWGNLIPAFDARFSDPHAVKIPAEIREMRKLEGRGVPSELTYGSSSSASLFYRQAKLMEDYEDDFPSSGTGFNQYYPTYAAMNDRQLRSYFSWRTRLRQGQMDEAPLSFAFVHVYELLCGIGTTPGTQGLNDLRAFGSAYREVNGYDGERLQNYLQRWTRDYAVYHDIVDELTPGPESGMGGAILTLLSAEHAQLRAADREPRIPNFAVGETSPTTEELFAALGEASSYHIGQSRLVKDEPELLMQVATDIFAELVMHCSKRRKTDCVEGLFGYATNLPYTMYAGAVYFEEEPHPDCRVQASPIESFTCTDGRWRQQRACEVTSRSSELGLYMHEVDFELRKQLDYGYPLKQRKVPKYVERMVQKAVAARLKERADAEEARRQAEEEAERRRITIDLSKLSGIRAAAAVTQEALLTDEERGLDVTEPPMEPLAGMSYPAAASEDAASQQDAPETPHLQPVEPALATPQPEQTEPATAHQPEQQAPAASHPTTPEPSSPTVASCPAQSEYGLSDLELRVLQGLVDGMPISELLGPTDPFVSVVIDTINEKLFDLVGDTIVEFDGDDPRIIEEDYLEDIREVLQP